jgi:diacylglycerol kinase
MLPETNLPPAPTRWGEEPRQDKRPRSWKAKLDEAFKGVKLGIRGHSTYSVHFFFAALAITAAVALQCGLIEWCLLVLCIGGVLTAELFHNAIERLIHGLDEENKSRWNGCLNIAAGAVLVASVTAFVVGAIIFVNRFVRMLS